MFRRKKKLTFAILYNHRILKLLSLLLFSRTAKKKNSFSPQFKDNHNFSLQWQKQKKEDEVKTKNKNQRSTTKFFEPQGEFK